MDFQFTQCDDFNALGFCPPTGVPAAAGDPYLGLLVDGHPRNYINNQGGFSGKMQLDWHASEDILVYASASRGLKGGGLNAPLDGFLEDSAVLYNPENLNAYEVGYKGTHFDGKMRLNVGAFYYDYNDFQAFIFEGNTSFIVNKEAEIYGGEAELIVAPGDGWELIGGLTLLEATVFDIDVNGVLYDQEIMMAPGLAANALVRKEWMLKNGSGVTVQVDGNYVSRQYFNNINHETMHGDAYVLANARITYVSADESYEVSAYINNITNKRYKKFGFDISAFDNFSILTYGKPRWAGVNFKYRWN